MPKIPIDLDVFGHDLIQNFYLRDGCAKKVPGTDKYNHVALGNIIRWATRYYGLLADGSFTKKLFCYAGSSIYLGDDVNGTLGAVRTGLNDTGIPEDVTLQVAGNSRMYVFNGYDTPVYYEGLGTTWQDSSITYRFAQGLEHDRRLWAFERNESILYFSRAGDPEDFSATYGGAITIGNAKDTVIKRIVIVGGYIYVFKTDGIYRILGNTQSNYRAELVIDYMGLIAQRAIAVVNGLAIFVSQQDKEIYQFNGTSQPKQLTGGGNQYYTSFADELDENKADDICATWDRRNGFFRLAYNNKNETTETYNNNELCFTTDEGFASGQLKWFETYGARISCYSNMVEQGDATLITGRSDEGYLMYHNRSNNWDNEAMQVTLRTDRIYPQDGSNVLFNSLYLRGTPSGGTITIKTYLDDRINTSSSNSLADTGETTTIGTISIPTQGTFHNWIPLLTGFNYGECIALEISDETLNKYIEIEKMILDVEAGDDVFNSLIG